MRKSNGTFWKLISILVSLAVLAGGAIYGYASLNHEVGDNTKDIAAREPDIEKNNEHRHVFEEKVTNMDKKIDKILEKVEKL